MKDQHDPYAGVIDVARNGVDEVIRLRAEVERLRALLADADERAHLAHAVSELAMKHRDIAEEESSVLRSALEEAEDVLRKVGCDMTADMAKAALAHNASLSDRLHDTLHDDA